MKVAAALGGDDDRAEICEVREMTSTAPQVSQRPASIGRTGDCTYAGRGVTFIVPVRNDSIGLKRCLESIRSQAFTGEIIVVDNGSSDDSVAVAHGFGATVLERPGLSISALRNLAAAQAHGELLAFIDADMQLAPGWLCAATAQFADSHVVAVGADYSAPPGANWIQRLYDAMRAHQHGVHMVRWLASGNMVVRRSAFDRIGGFDETLGTCEDWELCMRFRQAGGLVLSDSNIRSVHFGDPSTLWRLFRGELWRGRDNLRVSLRSVGSWRDLPSILVPVLWLTCGSLSLGLLAAGAAARQLPLAGLALVPIGFGLVLSTLRAWAIWHRARRRSSAAFGAAFLVAIVYDVARALALVVSVPHRRASQMPAGDLG